MPDTLPAALQGHLSCGTLFSTPPSLRLLKASELLDGTDHLGAITSKPLEIEILNENGKGRIPGFLVVIVQLAEFPRTLWRARTLSVSSCSKPSRMSSSCIRGVLSGTALSGGIPQPVYPQTPMRGELTTGRYTSSSAQG